MKNLIRRINLNFKHIIIKFEPHALRIKMQTFYISRPLHMHVYMFVCVCMYTQNQRITDIPFSTYLLRHIDLFTSNFLYFL
jgi:hypothetical protein